MRLQEEALVSAREKPVSTVDFQAEYRYVYSDLKRIGILAAIMFAVLITLALLARL